jgi:hypothetical protein
MAIGSVRHCRGDAVPAEKAKARVVEVVEFLDHHVVGTRAMKGFGTGMVHRLKREMTAT